MKSVWTEPITQNEISLAAKAFGPNGSITEAKKWGMHLLEILKAQTPCH